MKYFTKYLPVEGEIKEGDWYIGGVNNIPTKRSLGRDDNMANTKCTKVKLFLCSRNIFKGDMFYDESLNLNETFEALGDLKPTEYGNQYRFKVIGKISKDAVWVTEGMEFDKEDLFLNGIGQNWDNMTPLTGKNIIKIKCSQCKQFH